MSRAALVLVAACAWSTSPAGHGRSLTPVLAAGVPARADYHARRPGRAAPALPSHSVRGYDQRVRLLPDGRSHVTVVVRPEPTPLGGAYPVDPARLDPAVARWLEPDDESPSSESVEGLARQLAAGATLQLEVSERILWWVSRNVRHADTVTHAETPSETLAAGSGSCVGRSRLAVALARAAGLPARTVHGLVVPADAPRGAVLGSADFVLHRHVETHVDGVGWLPSDPGESIHLVDARHLFLALDDESYEPEEQRTLTLRLSQSPEGLSLVPLQAEPLTGPSLVLLGVLPAARTQPGGAVP